MRLPDLRPLLVPLLLVAGCGAPGATPGGSDPRYEEAHRLMRRGDFDAARALLDALPEDDDPMQGYKRMYLRREIERAAGTPQALWHGPAGSR